MNNFTNTFLARFFIRHKPIHSLSYSYYSRESLASVDDKTPFFVESAYGCEFSSLSKKATPISPIGCLYFGVPVLEYNTHYLFTHNLAFIETHGMFEFFVKSHSNKRWAGPTASMTFYIKKTILAEHPNGFFHFQVAPFIGKQRVEVHWGGNHQKTFLISSKKWINLPYSRADWTSSKHSHQLDNMTLTLNLPNAKAPHELDENNGDIRPRSIEFIRFFVSDNTRPDPDTVKVIKTEGSGK